MIKKYYFINKFDINNIDKQDKQTAIIYRNYLTKAPDQALILKIKKYIANCVPRNFFQILL